ncbi:Protein CBG12047 [Caenorhabditis briggsae]|uniref:Protein CBG12047 n=1 Tax=Caenorhabditis briggsae TaxID=6238 RepID=A8XEF3_CAEBR|nr:Protein CBG12047 [Caenorhabditis briggsae]CAP31088.1 Protein CBG12047 [Caenorhabditis briggsae]
MTTRLDFTTADLITCLICIREFDTKTRKPKVLHCGHTVCEECTAILKDPTVYVFSRILLDEKCWIILGCSVPDMSPIHISNRNVLRKDVDGTTHIVFAGKTGSPEEVVKFINDNGISIETGKLMPQMVHDEGNSKEAEGFVKVNRLATGQSAFKCAKAPTKLEEAEFRGSFELKASGSEGSIKLELVKKGVIPKNGFAVLGGCMTKPNPKRIKELTASTSTPSTSKAGAPEATVEEPLPKRRRCRK